MSQSSTANASADAEDGRAGATHRAGGGGARSTAGANPPATRQPRISTATLQSDRGLTGISDVVVAKLASLATHEIPGVHAMGTGRARAIGAVKGILPGVASESATQGIAVEVGERQAAIDVDIVVEYGHSLVEVSNAVRANIIERVEEMSGLEVVEVNINIDDIHIGDEYEGGPSRVE
jgi:uncharacterized alkaline shock family protein YloU